LSDEAKYRQQAIASDGSNSFWEGIQPGFTFSTATPGSKEFFAEVEDHRYKLESHIPELAKFSATDGKDVLEVGCGIATDGSRFSRAGARYTGVDQSAEAIGLATERFEMQGLNGRFIRSQATELPFDNDSFDFVYSWGVLHHLDNTQGAIAEIRRVLRPGGTALVMLYHRDSLNYRFSIMFLRRSLAALLLFRPGRWFAKKVTGENAELLESHQKLLQEKGFAYLRDRQMFLNNNTDGPGNPLSKVYSREEATKLFESQGFSNVSTEVRFLNLRAYPGGERLERSHLAHWLGRSLGWHLCIQAR